MNRKFFGLCSFIFLMLFSSISIAQLSSLKWVMILDKADEIVYIDTAQTKIIGNQLSVWVLNKFREAKSLANIPTPVKEYKTQYLFNRRNDRYSIIGNLYYDPNGKLLDQPLRTNFPGRRGSFSKKIPANSPIQLIREKAEEFIETGVVTIGESRYLAEQEDLDKSPEELISPSGQIDTAETEVADIPAVEDTVKAAVEEIQEDVSEQKTEVLEEVAAAVKDTLPPPPLPVEEIEDRANVENDEPDKITPIVEEIKEEPEVVQEEPVEEKVAEPEIEEPKTRTVMEEVTETFYREIYDPVNDTYLKVPAGTRKVMREKTVAVEDNRSDGENSSETKSDYNTKTERMVRQGIYSDGNLFVIQVLSGRNRAAAEAVVARLKRRGHNAFITEAFIQTKKATYYRVRVGYFNSLREARTYKNKL